MNRPTSLLSRSGGVASSGRRSVNHGLLRRWNTRIVLSSVREAEGISQVELTERTGLSGGTVFSIVKQLKKEGLIEEFGPGPSTVGRKPIQLRLNPSAKRVIAGVFHADETTVGVLDLAGRVECQTSFATRPDRGPAAVVRDLGKHVASLLRRARIPKSCVIGLGVASAGALDAPSGRVVLSYGLGWRDVPLKEMLEKELGVPTLLEVDTASFALAESHFGVGQGASNLMLIEADLFGCGAAFIADGRIVRGQNNVAGEIGGVIVPGPGGGQPELLHRLASGWSIIARARGAAVSDPSVQPAIGKTSEQGYDRAHLRDVFESARAGEANALAAVRDAAHALAITIANMVMTLNPALVVLSGRVIEDSVGMLTPMIRDLALGKLDLTVLRAVQIEQSRLGENAALLGAATLIYDELFRTPSLHR